MVLSVASNSKHVCATQERVKKNSSGDYITYYAEIISETEREREKDVGERESKRERERERERVRECVRGRELYYCKYNRFSQVPYVELYYSICIEANVFFLLCTTSIVMYIANIQTYTTVSLYVHVLSCYVFLPENISNFIEYYTIQLIYRFLT